MAAKVNERSQAVEAMAPGWHLTETLLGGTEAMRDAGEVYLPREAAEERAAHDNRLAVAVLFPAFSRTVQTLSAKPFSKPMTISEDMPAAMKPLMENIDLEGRNLDTFAADLMETALGPGLGGILVDFPTVPDDVTTLADERQHKLRPYWLHIKPNSILGWKAQKIDGVWQLSQLRLMECVEVDDGEFGTAEIEQVRVLGRGTWKTYREGEGEKKDQWVQHESGMVSLNYIPFVPFYGKRTGFMTAVPPLKELAYLNVKHWQSQSDQDNILHVARVPILTARQCGSDFALKIGASTAVNLGDNPDAELAYVEHTGAAIEAGKASLDDLKDEMRQAGAELLVIAQVQKTATETNSEDSVGMCALQRIAEGLEDAIDRALQITAEFMGLGDTGGSVELYDDYGAATMAEAAAQLVLTAAGAGVISNETARAELKRRNILSPDVSEEDEQARLDAQGPALGTMNDGGGNGPNGQ